MIELPQIAPHEGRWAAKARLAERVLSKRSEYGLDAVVETLLAIYADDNRIRFYVLDEGLAVFHAHRYELPTAILHAADYVEEDRCGPERLAFVRKNRNGPDRVLVVTREPPRQPRTWFARILDD